MDSSEILVGDTGAECPLIPSEVSTLSELFSSLLEPGLVCARRPSVLEHSVLSFCLPPHPPDDQRPCPTVSESCWCPSFPREPALEGCICISPSNLGAWEGGVGLRTQRRSAEAVCRCLYRI